MNYYNENNPYAVQWLKNLINAKLLPAGDIDSRSIVDVTAADIRHYTQCHFFAGLGGWSYALHLAEWPITESVWTGSCPCQPFSIAGAQNGDLDDRNLWFAFRRLINECRPPVVFGEQVASSLGRDWLSNVRLDLESLAYAIGAADLPAASVGAPHIRQRLWWVAHAEWNLSGANSWASGRMGRLEQSLSWNRPWLVALANFRTLADGVPRRVGAVIAARNAIVPQVAAEFISAYVDCW